LRLLTCKTVSQITYTVLVETLNSAQSIPNRSPFKVSQGHWRVETTQNFY